MFKEVNEQILKLIEKNSRLTPEEIASLLEMDVEEVTRRIKNNRRNSACDDGTSKRRHQRTRNPRKTWSALTQEYVLRIKEYIGLLTIRGCGALWS